MKSAVSFFLALLVSAQLILLAGCVAYRGEPVMAMGTTVEVAGPPPPPVAEVIPPSPGASYIWISGSWAWEHDWVWVRGRWCRPPFPNAEWVPNKYDHQRRVFIWGGWR
jgi:hypothetical protein